VYNEKEIYIPMRKRSELFFSLILVPVDYLALVAAFVAAYIVRVKIDARPVAHPIDAMTYLKFALILLPVWILIFALAGLYRQSSQRGRLSELGKIFIAVSGGVMFTILLDFVQTVPFFPSKAVPIYAYGFGLLFVSLARIGVRAIQRGLFTSGIGVYRIIIIGSGDLAQQIATGLTKTFSGYRIIGCIDVARGASRRMSGLPVYSSLEEALRHISAKDIDEIIQADSALESDKILELVSYASSHHLAYRFVPNQFGVYAIRSEMGNLAGIPIVEMKRTSLDGWGRILKRSLDFIGALTGLALLSPMFLAIYVVMKISDNGPVIYRHRRLSRVGGELYIYKFRSMAWQYCTGPTRPYKTAQDALAAIGREDLIPEFERSQKLENDPRVTKLGSFLRRTSLDELPQLINVLKGEMSLVGPRPIIPAELEFYGDQSASFLALKPGITGLWQISGRSDLNYSERVKLDIYYVENWTLWLDIKILLRTLAVLLGRKGAY
jgi:exopolysaccharide biosynthesis polyprenyl glycosylphosphotransferase